MNGVDITTDYVKIMKIEFFNRETDIVVLIVRSNKET